MPGVARYDGLADWYEQVFRSDGLRPGELEPLRRLLGPGGGRCLDVGCGTGAAHPYLVELGWQVIGVDVSEDQLRLARARGVDAVHARAEKLPFADRSFDAVVSLWTHTDVDDFSRTLHEVARVLRTGGPFVYVGAHPCFVGPHSRFVAAEGVPVLHSGYREARRYTDAPGISAEGLRARVGATQLPLGPFLQAFLDAGFVLDHFEEQPADREYPYIVATRWHR